jgi:hypothetical protein
VSTTWRAMCGCPKCESMTWRAMLACPCMEAAAAVRLQKRRRAKTNGAAARADKTTRRV